MYLFIIVLEIVSVMISLIKIFDQEIFLIVISITLRYADETECFNINKDSVIELLNTIDKLSFN